MAGNHRLPVNPKLQWSLDTRGVDEGQLCTPVGVALLPKGLIVVSELDNERLQVL